MFGILDNAKMGAAVLVGAALMFVAAAAYNMIFDNPAIRRETRALVEAEAERRTIDAIKTVSDAAERARAMRRYCGERGLLYDFAANKCRDG